MVREFVIRHDWAGRDVSRRASCQDFVVTSGEHEVIIRVWLTFSLLGAWGIGGRCGAEIVTPRAALSCLKDHLEVTSALRNHEITMTAGDVTELGDERTIRPGPKQNPYQWKECLYQERTKAGLVCGARHDQDQLKGLTTRAACRECDLPSTDVLCRNLMYPRTLPSGMDGLGLASRKVVDAQCDIRSAEFDRQPGLCVPGGHACWVQTHIAEEAPLAGGGTGPQFSVGEAIDQLNMAFRTRYGRKLIHIEHARSIEDLMSECPTDDAFQLKLQVLAGLLESMDLSGLVTEQETKDSQGTMDLLECLFKRDLPKLPGQHLRNLRSVNKLSNAYPRHPRV